jgi:hypothetical protein
MARKGGVPAERVINALDLPSFRAYLAARSECNGFQTVGLKMKFD